jgi:CRISPR-associated protein Csb3
MDELRIALDPANPGQFFASCGLFDILSSSSTGNCAYARFEADEAAPRQAHLIITGDDLPTPQTVLEELRNATSEPDDSVEENIRIQESIRPIRLVSSSQTIVLDWWLDEFRENTTPLKCWAGQVTTRKLFADLLPLIDPLTDTARLFTSAAMTRSKFGIDPRSAWNALDFGFSPDAHNRDAVTFPIVEVLGAIGLQGFRPIVDRRQASYFLWMTDLPTSVARLGGVAAWDGLPRFEYKFAISKRGQSYKFFDFAQFIERKTYYSNEQQQRATAT